MSLRLYNELEAVQKKNSQLEWENEALRERTQELEVTKQVLQAEVDKTREVSHRSRSRSRSRSHPPPPCWGDPPPHSCTQLSPPRGHVTHDPGADQRSEGRVRAAAGRSSLVCWSQNSRRS